MPTDQDELREARAMTPARWARAVERHEQARADRDRTIARELAAGASAVCLAAAYDLTRDMIYKIARKEAEGVASNDGAPAVTGAPRHSTTNNKGSIR